MSISRGEVDRWLAQYVDAWQSYDSDEITALFSDDIEYRYHPYDDPVRGRAEVATGSSTYRNTPDGPVDRVYDNCFVMRFDSEGRCREFTEWYMKRP